MRKIKTIFDRDWKGNRSVIDKYIEDKFLLRETKSVATEKLDGTNIRLTIRNHQVVRVEKRCNPSKIQKHQDIIEPWYIDVDEFNPQDKYIVEAVKSRTYEKINDGEWSGEAIGKKIQGNPLNLDGHTVCLFSCDEAPKFDNVPTDYEGLKKWLPEQESKFGTGKIEGIVWHCKDGNMYKIKTKDFK